MNELEQFGVPGARDVDGATCCECRHFYCKCGADQAGICRLKLAEQLDGLDAQAARHIYEPESFAEIAFDNIVYWNEVPCARWEA